MGQRGFQARFIEADRRICHQRCSPTTVNESALRQYRVNRRLKSGMNVSVQSGGALEVPDRQNPHSLDTRHCRVEHFTEHLHIATQIV